MVATTCRGSLHNLRSPGERPDDRNFSLRNVYRHHQRKDAMRKLLTFLIARRRLFLERVRHYDERKKFLAARRINAARHINGPTTERTAKGTYPTRYLILLSCGYLKKSL